MNIGLKYVVLYEVNDFSQRVQWRMIGSMMIYLCRIYGYISID